MFEVSNVTLRQLRNLKKMTQSECAKYLGIPFRTYQNYETDESKKDSIKYLKTIIQIYLGAPLKD
ncbi:MAG: helix-turn-helix domain-containing protein [Acholeplasmataceae bacterium]|jgi:transcriptional regulator with XRE-family HTH domain